MKQFASVGVLTALLFIGLIGGSACSHKRANPNESPTSSTTGDTGGSGIPATPSQSTPALTPDEPPISPGEIQSLPLVGSYHVQRTMLANGLKILVIEDHSSPTFAYQTWFKVGSREEVPGRTGLAHLFEHMMFKATTQYKDGDFDRYLDEAGAEGMNAFTTNDYTAYVQELPSSQLEMIMNLESIRMVNLVVDDASFKTEREVVQNERRMRYENNPDGILWTELDKLSYTNHPYHWPTIGYEQDLTAMTADDARKFYQLWYSPNKATVVVFGDVRAPQVFSLAKKYYGNIPATPDVPAEITFDEDPTSPRRKSLKLNLQVERLMMSYPIPAAAHEDMPALLLLSTLLSKGKSSRLYRSLVETGLATGAEAYAFEKRDPGTFVFEVSCQKGKKATHAEAAILREIQNLIQNPIGPTELERAKNQFLYSFYTDLSNPSKVANFVGTYETMLGDFQKGKLLYDATQKLTGEDLQRVAQKYLVPAKRSIIQGLIK